MKFSFRFSTVIFALFTALLLGSVIAVNEYIIRSTKDSLVSLKSSPSAPVGIILGASVYRDGSLSPILKDRADTAIELFEAEKIQKILISGDNGTDDYNEVVPTKKYLTEKGIPEEVIFLDYAGFDTYDTMYRAKHIFQVQEALVITQEFHLPRSLFLCTSIGIECKGVIADKHIYIKRYQYAYREFFANVKAIKDVLLEANPKYLGEVIDINKKVTIE